MATIRRSPVWATVLLALVVGIASAYFTQTHLVEARPSLAGLQTQIDALEQASGGLVVYDAKGEKIGDVVGGSGSISNLQPLVVVRSGERPFVIQVARNSFIGGVRGGPFYEDNTCDTPFITIFDSLFPNVTFGAPGPHTAYIIDSTIVSTEDATVIVDPFVLEQDGSCVREGRNQVAAFQATLIVNLNEFTSPFSVR